MDEHQSLSDMNIQSPPSPVAAPTPIAPSTSFVTTVSRPPQKRSQITFEPLCSVGGVESSESTTDREDEFDTFGKTIAFRLRKMSRVSDMQRIISEKLISDVLFYGELQTLSPNSSICVSPKRRETITPSASNHQAEEIDIKSEASESNYVLL